MKENKETKSIIIICNKRGYIENIIDDGKEFAGKNFIRKEFNSLIIERDSGKARDFFERIKQKRIALNYEMMIKNKKKEIMLVFTGVNIFKKILIIATDDYYFFNDILEEMSNMISEQSSIIRECIQDKARIAKIERDRIEKDLHDSISQTVFSTKLIAEMLPEIWKKDQQEALNQIEKIKLLTGESLREMRRLLLELRPDSFAEENLYELLKSLVSSAKLRSEIDIKLGFSGKGEPDKEVKEAVYRITQEALNNSMKHSQATQVKIAYRQLPDKISLKIKDNGRGFDINSISKDRYGLYIMRQRAESSGSKIKIISDKKKGTEIVFEHKV